MNEVIHKIGESYTAVREARGTSQKLSIRRVTDGFWLNFSAKEFQEYQPSIASDFEKTFSVIDSANPELVSAVVNEVSSQAVDTVYVYTDVDYPTAGQNTVEYERHVYGGRVAADEPDTCLIYGTLRDVSNRPLVGQKVEAYLNRAGFFTHKAGLIGYASTVLTDEQGYFELPLIQGLDVTINVPIIGFSQRGFVPTISSVELSTQTLLSFQPSGT